MLRLQLFSLNLHVKSQLQLPPSWFIGTHGFVVLVMEWVTFGSCLCKRHWRTFKKTKKSTDRTCWLVAVSHILLKHPRISTLQKTTIAAIPPTFRSRSNASKSAWQPISPKTERKALGKQCLNGFSLTRDVAIPFCKFWPSPGKLHGQCPRLSRALSIL